MRLLSAVLAWNVKTTYSLDLIRCYEESEVYHLEFPNTADVRRPGWVSAVGCDDALDRPSPMLREQHSVSSSGQYSQEFHNAAVVPPVSEWQNGALARPSLLLIKSIIPPLSGQ